MGLATTPSRPAGAPAARRSSGESAFVQLFGMAWSSPKPKGPPMERRELVKAAPRKASPAPEAAPAAEEPTSSDFDASVEVDPPSIPALPFPVTPKRPFGSDPLVTGRWFDRILILNLENTDYGPAVRDPHLRALNDPATHKNSLLLTNLRALAHPSQPNYVGQICGDTIVRDDGRYEINVRSIVDLLERRGVSWGSYNEGYPDHLKKDEVYLGMACNVSEYYLRPFTCRSHWSGLMPRMQRYVRRHNPFVSLTNISTNPNRVHRIKSGAAFLRDLQAGTLPQYIFYTPDQDNNGHDTSVAYAGKYISRFLAPLLRDKQLMENALVVVTFDETAWWVGSNRVATWILGDCVDVSACGNGKREDGDRYDHYSILRTVEMNWDLGDLGRNDRTAVPFRCLRRP